MSVTVTGHHGAPQASSTSARPSAAADPGAAVPAVHGLPVTLQPHGNLLKYYLLSAIIFPPAFIFVALPLYFRFRTLRYDVDAEGITMRWGVLFRREVSLTYARIQDIQLSSNVVERWLGLARIQLQTASGSATAEMTIEGILDVESMRDFLYSRMRGAADATPASAVTPKASAPLQVTSADADVAELTAALDAVAAELRALRSAMDTARNGADHG